MVEREEPAASTAMFRAFVQRREVEATGEKRLSPLVWVAGVVVLLAVVAAVVMVLS